MRLAERLERADANSRGEGQPWDDLQRLQDARDTLDIEIAAHEGRKNEILGAFGVATLSEVVERDELLRERDRLRAAVAELEEQLAAELAVEGCGQARTILDALDFDGLAVEKAEIEQRLPVWTKPYEQQLIRQTRAADKLDAIGGDSAVARIDAERRTVLLEIEDKAVRYIELKLGIMSAAKRLARLSRAPSLRDDGRASDAFALDHAGPVFGFDHPTGEGR